MMKYIIVCGPTCSGKTELGIQLALRYNGEIINADSKQIYKQTSIGTAKPGLAEMQGIKHHLFDILDIDDDFSAFKFAELAGQLIEDISKQGKLAIVVGGTGLYLKALTEGIFKSPEPDKEYRAKLEKIAKKEGSNKLHEMLADIDPEAAAKIKPRDKIRLVRALEAYKSTGRPISELQKTGEYRKIGKPLWIGISTDRKSLYEKINKRVDKMIDSGFEREVLALKPYLDTIRKKKMIGYTDMISYLFDKEITRTEAIEKMKQHHRNYAKRQITWFRKIDFINWFDPQSGDYYQNLFSICNNYLKSS
jgi:tRNA dimethylallyltransferase